MILSIAEAETRLAELIKSVEGGNVVIITRDGKPVAQIMPMSPKSRAPQFGTMQGKWELKPGWDDPITEEQFLSGDF